ncbi:hydrolase, partial [Micromonospora carbonacea]|uniref:hydrolase n=1 Tax=Micromonospora carbonacea TaxID=47853 RepID=UPI0033E795E7
MAARGQVGTTTRGGEVTIPAGDAGLPADVLVPAGATGVVVFAHGSGSSRHSPRNTAVAGVLNERALGTVLVDLLTPEEDRVDARTAELRFDIGLLADRLAAIVDWTGVEPALARLPVGLFGASTGAAAALVAAAARPEGGRGGVSPGGRADLAGGARSRGAVPALLGGGGRAGPVQR